MNKSLIKQVELVRTLTTTCIFYCLNIHIIERVYYHLHCKLLLTGITHYKHLQCRCNVVKCIPNNSNAFSLHSPQITVPGSVAGGNLPKFAGCHGQNQGTFCGWPSMLISHPCEGKVWRDDSDAVKPGGKNRRARKTERMRGWEIRGGSWLSIYQVIGSKKDAMTRKKWLNIFVKC